MESTISNNKDTLFAQIRALCAEKNYSRMDFNY